MILGQFAGGPSVRTDYNQTDPSKADYLVGRESIANHLANETNPHGVTAAQTGALPTAGGIMEGNIDLNGKVIYNVPLPNGWGDAVNKGFLTDHGVCGQGAYINDCDISDSGFYKFDAGVLNSPFDYGTMIVSGRYEGNCNQIAICQDGGDRGAIAFRQKGADGAEWEYLNPKCDLGREYRTTDRWNGKAVYTILVELGTLPQGESTVTLSDVWFTKVVDIRVTTDSKVVPDSMVYFHRGAKDAWITTNTTGDVVGSQAWAQLWYQRN